MIIAKLVFALCGATSIMCAILLIRSYMANRNRLLLWSAWGFSGLAVNNVILFVDLVLISSVDLSVIRQIPALIGIGVMVWGLIQDAIS